MKLRQRKKHTAIELDDSVISKQSGWMFHRSDTCDTAFLTIRHELREKLSKAINGLQKEYRTIFILRDVDKYSNQEVSDILDISVAAVKSRLHRARNILRNHLSEFYNHPNNSIHLNEKDFKQSASSCLREKEVNGVTQV